MPQLRVLIAGKTQLDIAYRPEQSGMIAQHLLDHWQALEARGPVVVTAQEDNVEWIICKSSRPPCSP